MANLAGWNQPRAPPPSFSANKKGGAATVEVFLQSPPRIDKRLSAKIQLGRLVTKRKLCCGENSRSRLLSPAGVTAVTPDVGCRDVRRFVTGKENKDGGNFLN